jgi:hypothetical protein
VLESAAWVRVSLCLNLAGTIILFFSFQATASDFRLITTRDGKAALCVSQYAVFISSEGGRELSLGHKTCPDWDNGKPAAVVNVEHPRFVTLGFILLMLGFVMQLLSTQPKTVAQIRKDLAIAKAKSRTRS